MRIFIELMLATFYISDIVQYYFEGCIYISSPTVWSTARASAYVSLIKYTHTAPIRSIIPARTSIFT